MIRKLTENDLPEGTAAKHFFFSAIVMLNIGVFMALGTSLRLAWPDILPNDIAWLHFGRIRPVHVHFVIFGWISMAFAGAMCYMTPALCKTKLWSERLGVINCWMWNIGSCAARKFSSSWRQQAAASSMATSSIAPPAK